MSDVLFWMEASALGQLMRNSAWLFPMAEMLHFMGLSLLMGALLVVDFRLLGFSRNTPIDAVYQFLPLTAAGFGINLVTGILFCFSDPFRYFPNVAFRLKMLLVLLAGLNVLYFALTAYGKTAQPGTDGVANRIKTVAALSLIFWTGVIILGRFIPYVE